MLLPVVTLFRRAAVVCCGIRRSNQTVTLLMVASGHLAVVEIGRRCRNGSTVGIMSWPFVIIICQYLIFSTTAHQNKNRVFKPCKGNKISLRVRRISFRRRSRHGNIQPKDEQDCSRKYFKKNVRFHCKKFFEKRKKEKLCQPWSGDAEAPVFLKLIRGYLFLLHIIVMVYIAALVPDMYTIYINYTNTKSWFGSLSPSWQLVSYRGRMRMFLRHIGSFFCEK